MKTNFSGLAMVAILIITSCTKDSDDTGALSGDPESQQKSASVYEQVAISHNLAMDYVGNHPSFNSLTKHERYEYIQGYRDDHYSFDNDTNWVEHNEKMVWGIAIANSPDSASYFLLEEGLIDQVHVGLIDSLFAIFAAAGDWDNETYMSVLDFEAEIAVLEEHIYNFYDPYFNVLEDSANFAGMMLAACEIAKGSFGYWREAATDTSHPWYDNFSTFNYTDGYIPKSFFGNVWHGIKVGAVDTAVFVGSMFSKECNRGASSKNLGPLFSITCAWGEAGEASSGV